MQIGCTDAPYLCADLKYIYNHQYENMSYFETILQKRGLEECPLPLWKLKITEEEFKELRDLLEKRTHVINLNNPFITVCKEATLFFAEYWRRMYVDGKHSKQMVYDALESTRPSVNYSNEFYEAARRGAKMLKIEKYDGGRADPLNDMLYQGGLPMKLVTANITNSVWDRFTRGLVNRKINFEELNLGLVASQSKCMKDYCEQLILGVEAERYLLMPFYCANENDVWFLYLKELAKQEKVRRHQLHPFSLTWEFRIDTVEKKIYTKYIVKGLQRLPQVFLEEQGIDDIGFFSVQVRKNGQAVDTFDYANNFCRYPVFSKHPCENGDFISLFLHNQEYAHIGDDLDISVPHLLYRNKDGKYELGNQLGRQESIILIPDGWNLQTETNLDIYEYSWGMTKLQGLHIPADYTDNIVLKGEDGCITLGMNAPLYWTELQSSPLYVPDVIESLYDANKCAFTLCYDTEDGTESKRHNVQYRNKWQNVWTDTPSFGEIFARAIDTNGNYVAPLRFINIGEGLVISLQKADKSSCQIKVSWAHGHVSTTEGEKKIGDVWEIKKENCNDPRKIRFTFTPSGNSKNQFDISIKAPFKDFSIKNIYGDDIENDCWIPYSDIDKYQYHLVGQDIREYTYGNVRRELRWKGEKLYIFEDGRALKTIPYEGSLLTLFDSREAIRSLLERTAQNMLNAEVNVQFVLSNGQRIAFGIKESPFRPRQISDGRVVITGKNRKPFKFTGVLKLIKLDEPNLEPLEMKYDEESQYYILPEEIRSWGKTILVGRTRGRICPALVDLTKDMNGSYRAENRENAILNIREKLNDSLLGDELWTRIIGWFNRAQQEDIPASSILELYCTAQDYKALLCLAFQLYVKCSDNDEREILKEKLKSFSNDLAFQWYWLQPYLSGIFIQLQNFMSDPMTPAMQDIFIKWAMSHEGEDMMKYLSALNVEEEYMKNLGQCLYDVLTSFTEWIKDLCVSSLIEAYGYVSHGLVEELAETIIKKPKEIRLLELSTDEYIESNQDYLGDEVGTFFNNFNEQGKVGNEMWLYKRVNAVVAHIRKEIDLFSIKDEIQRDKIRRSIIFCSKSCNRHFIVALNNKLSH